MANINNQQTFDNNYLLTEKPADGYYISASNYLPNHEPDLLTQPNRRLFKTRGGECEIKFYFENHGRFYRPDIFCPFNLNSTGTPDLKFRLQLSRSTTIPIVTCYSNAQLGSTSITLASTDALSLDASNWITINGLSTKYWLDSQYDWLVGGDYVTVGLVDAFGTPLGLESAIFAGDNVYYDKLGEDETDIIFDQEYLGVLPIYPWGVWTPYSLTIPWGGYDIDGRTEQFITTINDDDYLSSDSVYCGKLTITGGSVTGLAIQRLFIGQATIKNAYIRKPFGTNVNFVNDQLIDGISIQYDNLDIITYTLLNEMAKTVVLVGDDVLFYLRHAEKNYVYAGFIPKNEQKLTLMDSVIACDAKFLNEWDYNLTVNGYS